MPEILEFNTPGNFKLRQIMVQTFAPALNEAVGTEDFPGVMRDIQEVEDYIIGEPK